MESLLPKDTKSKRLRIPPDKSFLEDLTEWRTIQKRRRHGIFSPINFNLSLINFVLVVNALAEAEKFQQALKLISPYSYSGISIGFGKTNFMYGVFHIEPTPYYGKEIFELGKESKSDIDELYEHGKLIYDIRSKIVHKGSDDRVKSSLDQLIRYSQSAILRYIEDRSLFTEPKLDRICLD